MSPQLRTELQDLLQRATRIEALAGTENLHAVTNLHQDWLPAVEQTQATVRQLSQQMRRLLDDKVFLENKRIMQLIRSIESGALATREAPPSGVFMDIAAPSVDVALPFERPLYEPSRKVMVDDDVVAADDARRGRRRPVQPVPRGHGAAQGQHRRRPGRRGAGHPGGHHRRLPAVPGPGGDRRLLPAGHGVRRGRTSTPTPRSSCPGSSRTAASAKRPSTGSSLEGPHEPRRDPSPRPETRTPEELPGVVTRLFKGVVYAEADEKIWQSLLGLASQVRDYVAVLGLDLILDESEGYAFLKSREDPDGTLPRLIARRQLTFNVSLLLALLRAPACWSSTPTAASSGSS